MTLRTRRTTFLRQLTIMAKRNKLWKMVKKQSAIIAHQEGYVVAHIGNAY
jgi:hypothetical protein